MSNIHKLTEHALPGEVDAELVDAIRDLLGRAERGEITAAAWATVSPNGDTLSGWEGMAGTLHPLAAAIMCLQWRFAAGMHE